MLVPDVLLARSNASDTRYHYCHPFCRMSDMTALSPHEPLEAVSTVSFFWDFARATLYCSDIQTPHTLARHNLLLLGRCPKRLQLRKRHLPILS